MSRWDQNEPTDAELLGYDPKLCRGNERRWADAELAAAKGELKREHNENEKDNEKRA